MFDDDSMFKEMRRFFHNMPFLDEDFENLCDINDVPKGQPVVWGYQYSIGPDGVPKYSVYSNVDKIQKRLVDRFSGPVNLGLPSPTELSENQSVDKEGYRVPQTDVVEDEDTLRVIVELPGVDKKDIEVTAKENFLAVVTTNEQYKYKAEIPLKVATIPKKIKASFKNGILELKLPIVKNNTEDKGDKVSIE